MNYTIATNRRASFDYEIEDKIEAGILLTGSEVKSLRINRANFNDTYVAAKNNELWVQNLHIPSYKFAHKTYNHQPNRLRKLLLHRKQITTLTNVVNIKRKTIIPLSIYSNDRGIIKMEIAIATGKKLHDKRRAIQKRELDRETQRMLRKDEKEF